MSDLVRNPEDRFSPVTAHLWQVVPRHILWSTSALVVPSCVYQDNICAVNSHFYKEQLGFAGVYLFFIFNPKDRLWVLVRTASPINVLSKYVKNINIFSN